MTMNYRHATGYDDSNLVLRISSLSLSLSNHGNEAKEISKKSRSRHLPDWQVFCRPHWDLKSTPISLKLLSLSGFRLRRQEWIDRRRVQLGKVAVHIGISKNSYPKRKIKLEKNKTKQKHVTRFEGQQKTFFLFAASRDLKSKYKYKFI